MTTVLEIVTDPAHGGRWTSLHAGGREWLWHGTAAGRDRVSPGDVSVDAGGLEECVPTVRGAPAHGKGDVPHITTARVGLTRPGPDDGALFAVRVEVPGPPAAVYRPHPDAGPGAAPAPARV
ncbi:hypothetical protein [Streptomyces antimycoticus]|uniref:hypothetical protein n=1 Tax=Streptomyces antimycoticus TaxID=68175 RepID=UPI003F4E14BD